MQRILLTASPFLRGLPRSSLAYLPPQSLPVFREYGMKDLLPLKLEEPEDGCIRPNQDVYCFDAGDGRVNEQLVRSRPSAAFIVCVACLHPSLWLNPLSSISRSHSCLFLLNYSSVHLPLFCLYKFKGKEEECWEEGEQGEREKNGLHKIVLKVPYPLPQAQQQNMTSIYPKLFF